MRLFSTEQVSKYHPDKYADQISDAILTHYMKEYPGAHCGIETLVKDDKIVLAGEVNAPRRLDHGDIARAVAAKLGYQAQTVIDLIGQQSEEIRQAVDNVEDFGAGDQGIMFGYACRESASFLPYGFDLANNIIAAIEADVEQNPDTILLGDAKTQVTVDLDKKGRKSIDTIVVSAAHKPGYTLEAVRLYIKDLLMTRVNELNGGNPFWFTINPAGTWTLAGPYADAGLTGRKIVCDQYGGYCPVGGGAFSGKDPTKVDRSASYMAREIAVNLLQKYRLDWVRVQLAYAIGIAEPVSVRIDNSEFMALDSFVQQTYPLTPSGIIRHLDLMNKDYEHIAEGCHYRAGSGI